MAACIIFGRGYKYQLRAGYAVLLSELADPTRAPIVTPWIELDPDGTMRFRPGYAWDGASGPTIDTRDSMRASLVHDGLCQLMRLGLLSHAARPVVDLVFKRICLNDGMWSARAQLWYMAVRIFGDRATTAAGETPDERAGCGCPPI